MFSLAMIEGLEGVDWVGVAGAVRGFGMGDDQVKGVGESIVTNVYPKCFEIALDHDIVRQ